MEAIPGARRHRHRTTDLRHRTGAHWHYCAAPATRRRPGASGSAPVVGRVPAATSAARDLGIEPAVSPTRRAVHPAPRGKPGLHRPAFHGRIRAGGMLATAAAVAAFGVLRNPCAPTQLRGVAVAARLDAVISAAPQEPSVDRTE